MRASKSASQTLDNVGQVITFTCHTGFAFSGNPVEMVSTLPTTTTTTTTTTTPTPLDWRSYGGADWAMVEVTSPGLTWSQAEAACQLHGANLASITSWQVQKWINGEFGSSHEKWIGGRDSGEEGSFTWARGDEWLYTNWHSCPPSNDETVNCVKTRQSSSGRWSVEDCEAQVRRYLCQRQEATTAPLWNMIHGAQYAYLENSRCIRSWDQARTSCQALGDGADLASVLSEEVISEYRTLFNDVITEYSYWIGQSL